MIVNFILSRMSFPGKIVVFYVDGKVSNTSDQTFSGTIIPPLVKRKGWWLKPVGLFQAHAFGLCCTRHFNFYFFISVFYSFFTLEKKFQFYLK